MSNLIDSSLNLQFDLEITIQPQLEDVLASGMDQLISQLPNMTQIPTPFVAALTATLYQFWTRSIHSSADLTISELTHSAKQSQFFDLLTSDYITRYGRKKLVQIAATTAKQVQDSVRQDMARGESFLSAVKKLSAEVPSMARRRAKVILATESHAANQYASQRAAERSGQLLLKVWNSIVDDRTRRFGVLGRQDAFNHLAMNQTSVLLNSTYSVPRLTGGFERLYFPGDPDGSAGNIINCRCIQTYERA